MVRCVDMCVRIQLSYAVVVVILKCHLHIILCLAFNHFHLRVLCCILLHAVQYRLHVQSVILLSLSYSCYHFQSMIAFECVRSFLAWMQSAYLHYSFFALRYIASHCIWRSWMWEMNELCTVNEHTAKCRGGGKETEDSKWRRRRRRTQTHKHTRRQTHSFSTNSPLKHSSNGAVTNIQNECVYGIRSFWNGMLRFSWTLSPIVTWLSPVCTFSK